MNDIENTINITTRILNKIIPNQQKKLMTVRIQIYLLINVNKNVYLCN